MQVAEVWQYPVKSMQGSQVGAGRVGARGLDGDRRWAVVDADGRALSAKWEPKLLLASARLDGDRAVVTLPDGTEAAGDDPAGDRALSDWLARPVRLERGDPAVRRSFRLHDDPLDDTSAPMEYPCPPGTFHDAAAVHLLTTASLGHWPVRRFRPTVLVEAGGDERYPEDGWVGRRVRLGERVVVRVIVATDRCAMPARAQPGLDRDPGVIRSIVAEHGRRLGVYAGVVMPGTVRDGDEVEVLADRS